MRIDDKRIGAVAPLKHPSHLGHDGSRPSVGSVYVQPQAFALANVCYARDRINACRRGCSDRGDNAEGEPPVLSVLSYCAVKLARQHSEFAVRCDLSHASLPYAERYRGLVYRRVRLLRGVESQARRFLTSARQSFFAH